MSREFDKFLVGRCRYNVKFPAPELIASTVNVELNRDAQATVDQLVYRRFDVQRVRSKKHAKRQNTQRPIDLYHRWGGHS